MNKHIKKLKKLVNNLGIDYLTDNSEFHKFLSKNCDFNNKEKRTYNLTNTYPYKNAINFSNIEINNCCFSDGFFSTEMIFKFSLESLNIINSLTTIRDEFKDFLINNSDLDIGFVIMKSENKVFITKELLHFSVNELLEKIIDCEDYLLYNNVRVSNKLVKALIKALELFYAFINKVLPESEELSAKCFGCGIKIELKESEIDQFCVNCKENTTIDEKYDIISALTGKPRPFTTYLRVRVYRGNECIQELNFTSFKESFEFFNERNVTYLYRSFVIYIRLSKTSKYFDDLTIQNYDELIEYLGRN